MGKLSTKTKEVRSIERHAQIDIESEGAIRLFGIDPESSKRMMDEMGKGKRVWGLQAVQDAPAKTSTASTNVGEISGWPLDPNSYGRDGCLDQNNLKETSHDEGSVNGMDYRGMIPGVIPIVEVEESTNNLSPHLNIP